MITIIVDTKDEYDKMLAFAEDFVCKRVPVVKCGKYPAEACYNCFMDNHVECGIRLIPPVDSNNQNKL